MRSIRRSLTLYVLGLLGLGLGAVAGLADRVMARTLAARQAAASELVEARAHEREGELREKFDQELLGTARSIGRVIQFQYFQRFDQEARKFQLGLVVQTVGAGAGGPLPLAAWATGVAPRGRSPFGPLSGPLAREYFVHLHLDDLYLRQLDDDEHSPEYVQLNSVRPTSMWRSAGLSADPLPFDPDALNTGQLVEWKFDDVTLPTGVAVRRAVFKTPLTLGWVRVPFPRGGGPPPPRRFDPPSRVPPEADPVPSVFIHYARPAAELDRRLAVIRADADRQRADIDWETARDRTAFRFWLAVIGGATFVGTLVGGPLLIRRGLGPLSALSDAVSRVTEKDFRLPVRADQLTRELAPIHARMQSTLDALRRAFEHEKQATADISHELRTPIAALQTTLDVALRKPRTADQYRAALEDCRAITRQLGGLVERVMALAWVDAGADRVATEPADARDVAADCAVVIKPLAAAAGLTLSTALAVPTPLVTDPGKLREVVMNLLHNAVEYNRPGGSISLAVSPTPAGGAAVEVRDTGIGMAADVRDRIFERFYRADASRHAAGVHAGLGLAIVKEYVGQMGGAIAVDSEPGVGSTFRVTVPTLAGGKKAADG